jgi:hypothetical protein
MTTDPHTRLSEQDLAAFLHQRLHRSQKILMCKSDMALAQEIVALLNGTQDEQAEEEA